MSVVDYLIDISENYYLDSTDYRIIFYLLKRPRTARELAEKLNLSRNTIYTHMKSLTSLRFRTAIVKAKRKGNCNEYSIN